jgi:hypothetical protein
MRRFAATALIGILALAMSAAVSSPAVAGGKHYGYGYHGGYGHHGHGHYGHHYYGAAVAVGLAGLVVGWLLHDADYYYAPPRTVYVPAPVRTVYVPAPVRTVYVPATVRYAGPTAQARPLPPGCLMIREYQTRITVGGRQVDAYGDACLQADGSWRRFAPKLVPE